MTTRLREFLNRSHFSTDAVSSSYSPNQIGSAFLILDRHLKIKNCNQAYKDLISKSDIRNGQDFFEVHPGAADTHFQRQFHQSLTESMPTVIEDYNRPMEAWFEYRLNPLEDCLSVLIFNIHSRKQDEIFSSSREEQARVSFDESAVGIARLGLGGRWLSMNSRAREVLGCDSKDVTQFSLNEISLPEDRARDEEEIAALMCGDCKTITSERQVYRPDGSLTWIQLKVALARSKDSRPQFFIVNMDCIDERKEAEESLQFALEAAAMGNWDYDSGTDTTRRSPQFNRIFGYKRAPAIWSYADFIQSTHPEDRVSVETSFRKALTRGRSFILESRIVWPDESVHWISLRGRVYLNNFGKAVRMAGVVMDVTREKLAEHELQNAKLAAEDANREKSYFLANMSHEIRTPLGAILGFAEILSEPNLSLEDRLDHAKVITRNGQNLTALIDDILDLSKVEAGHLEVEKTRVNVWELLEGVCTLLKVNADAKRLDLSVRAENLVPRLIMADPIRLRQVLLNIVGNAIKFTPSGSVTVSIKFSSTPGQSIPFLDFKVQDTGVGISSSAAQRLFNPFTQADSSTTRKFGGTGLGLALSRRLTRAMGGDLVLHNSTPDEGSTFLIRIAAPLAAPEVSSVSSPKFLAQENLVLTDSLLGMKILVADDSSDNQFLLKRMLDKRGAAIELADDGSDAVKKALQNSFDIILMDMQMPHLDGYEATRELRRHGFDRPIVALTANAMRHDRDKCLEAGCSEYLSKPVDPNQLYEVVRDLVRANRH